MVKTPSQKQQQISNELCGASTRALTGLSDLRHRGRALFVLGKKVNTAAPHLNSNSESDSFRSLRGAADGIAMQLLYSDVELHRSLCPDEPVQRLIFEMLEQLRVETRVLNRFPGVKSNLEYRFRDWSLQFHAAGHTETQLGLLIYTIAQVAWSRLTGNPTLEETDDLIEVTRGTIAPVIGKQLAGLRRERHDQLAYSVHALLIAQIVDNSLRANESATGSERDKESDTEKELRRITLALDFSDELEDDNFATVVTGTSKVLQDSARGYQIFTRDYDTEFKASSRIREAELREFRERIDRSIHAQGINIPRLARNISELLATPRRDGWLYGEEEGILDGRRLTQVVAAPGERRLFRKQQYVFKNDCLVSFLIDCSGSMKQHIDYIAMLADIFCRALDQAQIAVEILGFTTASWNGGRAYKDWKAVKVENPGRLNEQQHLIFKDADTSWRRARRDIAALLKTTSFREGIDGEAVEWACQRMRRHGESRKLLFVISDGSPMDSATNLTNDEFYLDNHLKQVIESYDARSGVEIYGIGVGLSLTPYYNHSIAIDLSESLSNAVFLQILQMVHHAQRR